MAKSKATSAKRSPSVVALFITLMLTREERAIRLDLEALRGIANAKIKINGRYMREVAAALDSHKVLTYQIGEQELAFVDIRAQSLRKALPQTLDDICGDIHWIEENPSLLTRRLAVLIDAVNGFADKQACCLD